MFSPTFKYCKAFAIFLSDDDKFLLNSLYTEFKNDSEVNMYAWIGKKFEEYLLE